MTRNMTILMAAALAGGLLATDAQARGGGGGHMVEDLVAAKLAMATSARRARG